MNLQKLDSYHPRPALMIYRQRVVPEVAVFEDQDDNFDINELIAEIDPKKTCVTIDFEDESACLVELFKNKVNGRNGKKLFKRSVLLLNDVLYCEVHVGKLFSARECELNSRKHMKYPVTWEERIVRKEGAVKVEFLNNHAIVYRT